MSDLSSIYEKLGQFYLGREFDVTAGQCQDNLVLYDSKDLVTHAVCVGMTGSGKTGLGITLIEEAAIDGIPSLVIDPKGDLTNLLLNFPELRPADFAPWINADDAAREGISVELLAERRAEEWRAGLTKWHQTPARIARIMDRCDVNIFTPGSDAGIPISIVSSFAPPPPEILDDQDVFRDRINSTVTSLLALLGIAADPIRSREHILLSSILDQQWRQARPLDLGSIIRMIQEPPFAKVGVLDLESFYPAKERFELAMAMNNLLAAPGFATWMAGEPLDIGRLLHGPDGKPRISIISIAHLPENERMFFVSLFLNQTIGWMRSLPGTTSLRAMLYIDEIFGFMPPVAEPPSKRPLLTLLKQARAFGLGLVLATQNPVDLDYKGLSNAGTWFLGRLQTERDKQRVLDGLEGVAAASGGSFDRARISEILSALKQRVFLLHNVHEMAPVVFQTRWALSYLAGPLTRTQIKRLMADRKGLRPEPTTRASTVPARAEVDATHWNSGRSEETAGAGSAAGSGRGEKRMPSTGTRPVLPPNVQEAFLPVGPEISRGAPIRYEPRLLAFARVHYTDTRKGLSADQELALLTPFTGHGGFGIDWSSAEESTLRPGDLQKQPDAVAHFAELPPEACVAKSYSTWTKGLTEFLYRNRRYALFSCRDLGATSRPGEDERDFRLRLAAELREARDAQVEKLREKYASRLATLEERLRKAEQKLEREELEAKNAKMNSVISIGATILQTVLGRKRMGVASVGRAGSAARGVGRASQQESDVRRASDDVASYEDKLATLEDELKQEVEAIEDRLDPTTIPIDELLLKPRKTDVDVRHLTLAWLPVED